MRIWGRANGFLNSPCLKTTVSDSYSNLSGYVERMKEDQNSIYYITGDNIDAIKKSPQLEGFRAKGIEVLLLSDPVDSFWLNRQSAFESKNFKSVTQGSAELDQMNDAEDQKTDSEKPDTPNLDTAYRGL